ELSAFLRATDTAEFLSFGDKLFDSVNGCSIFNKSGKTLKTRVDLTRAENVHRQFWKDAIQIFDSMHYLDNDKIVVPLIASPAVYPVENSSSVLIPLEESTPSISDCSSSISYVVEEQPVSHSTPQTTILTKSITDFDLKEVLTSSAIGKALLNWYAIKGGFDSTRQGYLVEIIATYFFKQKHYELFPCEISEAYYLPPVKKRDSRDNKSGVAKGKLVDKFRNKLTFLREAGLLPSRGEHSDKENQISRIYPSKMKKRYENADPKTTASLIWLQNNKEPWQEVLFHWDNTFDYRRRRILSETNQLTLNEIFLKFSVLSEPLGLNLVSKDFDKIYADKSTLFYQNWEKNIFKLIKIRKQFVVSDTDKLLLELLDTGNLEKDYFHYLMVTLLASLLPCKARHLCANKKQWKPRTVDSREGLILRAELPGDVETVIQRKKEKLNKLDVPIQPYVIVERSGTTIRKVYVYINEQLFQVSTVLKAIDTCFQCYHVFNLRYQFESEHMWAFIQHSMYELRTKWDSTIPNILDIVNKVKRQ
ncbi:hypothetical protein NQ315_003298, partial [Exocentrus adspersus]